MSEVIMNGNWFPPFTAYSAGSHPKSAVHPAALQQIQNAKLPMIDLRAEHWAGFAKPGAPQMASVFTVCDDTAKACPVWPGQPMTAHWGVPDPPAATGTPEHIERAFRDAFLVLDRRISLLLCMPLSSPDKRTIQRE
jgi:arsenate reductase (thioredoxin)